MNITLLHHPCSRCKKPAAALHAYHFSKVVYKGKEIEAPWLCVKCFLREKEKAWSPPL